MSSRPAIRANSKLTGSMRPAADARQHAGDDPGVPAAKPAGDHPRAGQPHPGVPAAGPHRAPGAPSGAAARHHRVRPRATLQQTHQSRQQRPAGSAGSRHQMFACSGGLAYAVMTGAGKQRMPPEKCCFLSKTKVLNSSFDTTEATCPVLTFVCCAFAVRTPGPRRQRSPAGQRSRTTHQTRRTARMSRCRRVTLEHNPTRRSRKWKAACSWTCSAVRHTRMPQPERRGVEMTLAGSGQCANCY